MIYTSAAHVHEWLISSVWINHKFDYSSVFTLCIVFIEAEIRLYGQKLQVRGGFLYRQAWAKMLMIWIKGEKRDTHRITSFRVPSDWQIQSVLGGKRSSEILMAMIKQGWDFNICLCNNTIMECNLLHCPCLWSSLRFHFPSLHFILV